MNTFFKGIFDTELTSAIDVTDFLLCLSVSLILGLVTAVSYMFKNKHSKSFVITLALLPAAVCVVIMMVNGNVGAGVAVAGAFSLVRFRSAPGSAKEIVAIFLAMGTGLITGMGYLGLAALFTIIMCVMLLIYNLLGIGGKSADTVSKTLKITIPEDLDYPGVFDDIFAKYTKNYELVKVKTTNMGSMFLLTYDVILQDIKKEKEMIDMFRTRNGNLEIMISKRETDSGEL